eukprot:1143481-Pelagomonas_calceolata.AAC.4
MLHNRWGDAYTSAAPLFVVYAASLPAVAACGGQHACCSCCCADAHGQPPLHDTMYPCPTATPLLLACSILCPRAITRAGTADAARADTTA